MEKQDTHGGDMRITRKQLRHLIETTIKPTIPNLPSDEALGKIDVLARADDHRLQADSLADTFGYPDDRSYSDDLRVYDEAGLPEDIPKMRDLGTSYADAESHGEPEEYYIRRSALRKAAEICDSHDFSFAKVLIDAFTEAANDYEEKSMALIGRQPRFEYEAYDIAGRITLNSGKPYQRKENYSNLYDGTYINETTIKPTIPNVPSDEALAKINSVDAMQADSFAGAFGYPADRSYSDDLKTYDAANRVTFDSVNVKPLGQTEAEVLTIPIPYELVDTLIKEHEVVFGLKASGGFSGTNAQNSGWALRTAAVNIFRHIHDYLDDKYGRDNYDIYSYGSEGGGGYRYDEYSNAMQRGGEYI